MQYCSNRFSLELSFLQVFFELILVQVLSWRLCSTFEGHLTLTPVPPSCSRQLILRQPQNAPWTSTAALIIPRVQELHGGASRLVEVSARCTNLSGFRGSLSLVAAHASTLRWGVVLHWLLRCRVARRSKTCKCCERGDAFCLDGKQVWLVCIHSSVSLYWNQCKTATGDLISWPISL